jgi:hypothetical protein
VDRRERRSSFERHSGRSLLERHHSLSGGARRGSGAGALLRPSLSRASRSHPGRGVHFLRACPGSWNIARDAAALDAAALDGGGWVLMGASNGRVRMRRPGTPGPRAMTHRAQNIFSTSTHPACVALSAATFDSLKEITDVLSNT